MRTPFGTQVKLIRHRLSKGKHPTSKRMGFARRNKGNGVTNWIVLVKAFPTHREEIKRTYDPVKMMELLKRLEVKYDKRVPFHQPG
jgi:hypothetical protein